MSTPLTGVSKTAILTLRARADEHRMRGRLFADPLAVEWSGKLSWPPELTHWYTSWVQTKLVFRVDQIDKLVARRIAEIPGATVVELGCGLSSRFARIGAGTPWIDLDLPQMIEARTALGAGSGWGAGHRHVASSVLELSWFDAVADIPPAKLIFIAEGLFYYLPRADVDRLFRELRRKFTGATIIFDVIGAQDLKPSVASSARAGTPILWAVEPPFEDAMTRMGLEVLPGFEPAWVMDDMIERFRVRFGGAFRFIVHSLARIPTFRDRRSGIMIGRLASLPS